jgi:hypothetical protein
MQFRFTDQADAEVSPCICAPTGLILKATKPWGLHQPATQRDTGIRRSARMVRPCAKVDRESGTASGFRWRIRIGL